LNGWDAVVSSLGTGLSPFREVSLQTVATRAVVTAMTRNGVRRLVSISALAVGGTAVTAASCSPAHSIGSSSGPPCLPMTQLVGASGPSPTSQASKAASSHAPVSLGSWWSN